ncbi:MAG: hypothetical protein MI919_12095, partial [Holophagales bacterium]|nr:hypothetical protein [Holophagales bacterium]
MPPLHTEDRALVSRLLRGDAAAFDTFFDRNFPGLFRFARSRLGEDPAAEEVAQAALAKAVHKLGSYRGEASLFSWLCTFCRHEMHAHLESAARRPEPMGFLDDVPELRAMLESAGRGGLDPEGELRKKELTHWVRTTLEHRP